MYARLYWRAVHALRGGFCAHRTVRLRCLSQLRNLGGPDLLGSHCDDCHTLFVRQGCHSRQTRRVGLVYALHQDHSVFVPDERCGDDLCVRLEELVFYGPLDCAIPRLKHRHCPHEVVVVSGDYRLIISIICKTLCRIHPQSYLKSFKTNKAHTHTHTLRKDRQTVRR